LRHWDELILYLDDGRLEMDTNVVERAIRPVCITRNYAHLLIMRRCGASCADLPVDRAVRDALLTTNCT